MNLLAFVLFALCLALASAQPGMVLKNPKSYLTSGSFGLRFVIELQADPLILLGLSGDTLTPGTSSEIYFSQNLGRNWTYMGDLPNGINFPNGAFLPKLLKSPATGEIFLSKYKGSIPDFYPSFWYTLNGINWTGPFIYTLQTLRSHDFDIAPNGTILLATAEDTPTISYPESDIFLYRSDNHGRNFNALGKAAAYMDIDPQAYQSSIDTGTTVSSMGNGKWFVAWQNTPDDRSDTDLFGIVSVDDGLTWTEPFWVNFHASFDDIQYASDQNIDSAYDPTNNLLITVWETNFNDTAGATQSMSNSEIVFSRSSDGVTWGPSQKLVPWPSSDSRSDKNPQIVFKNGIWIVAWLETVPNVTNHASWSNDGLTWNYIGSLQTTPGDFWNLLALSTSQLFYHIQFKATIFSYQTVFGPTSCSPSTVLCDNNCSVVCTLFSNATPIPVPTLSEPSPTPISIPTISPIPIQPPTPSAFLPSSQPSPTPFQANPSPIVPLAPLGSPSPSFPIPGPLTLSPMPPSTLFSPSPRGLCSGSSTPDMICSGQYWILNSTTIVLITNSTTLQNGSYSVSADLNLISKIFETDGTLIIQSSSLVLNGDLILVGYNVLDISGSTMVIDGSLVLGPYAVVNVKYNSGVSIPLDVKGCILGSGTLNLDISNSSDLTLGRREFPFSSETDANCPISRTKLVVQDDNPCRKYTDRSIIQRDSHLYAAFNAIDVCFGVLAQPSTLVVFLTAGFFSL